MSEKKEYFDVYGFIDGTSMKIGYAFKTDQGSLRLVGENHIYAAKLGKAMQKGLEIKKRGLKNKPLTDDAGESDRSSTPAASRFNDTAA